MFWIERFINHANLLIFGDLKMDIKKLIGLSKKDRYMDWPEYQMIVSTRDILEFFERNI